MHDLERWSMVSSDLLEIGRYLIEIANDEGHLRRTIRKRAASLPAATEASRVPGDWDDLISIARCEYNERLLRTKYIQAELLGEPAWDILVDLFIAKAAGVRISISSACIASRVPYTTALRWLKLLEQNGLIARFDDSDDGRRSWIELTEDGLHRMAAYFRTRRKQT